MNELIEKFPNGRKLYIESPIFNRIINTMFHSGLSEYQAIEHLINRIESKQKEDIEALKKSNFPTMTIHCNKKLIGCPLKGGDYDKTKEI